MPKALQSGSVAKNGVLLSGILSMPISKTIKRFLESKHIIYSVLEVPHVDSLTQLAVTANIPPRSLYYASVLRDSFGLMMAILPASHKLNIERLAEQLHRRVEPAFETQLAAVFADCDPGYIPPVGVAYTIRTIIDSNLETPEEVYILSGDWARLIKVTRKDFMLLQNNAWLGSDFSDLMAGQQAAAGDIETPSSETIETLPPNIQQRIKSLDRPPAMPEMAGKLFELRGDPLADVDGLVQVVESDPGLSAQVMRYAHAPFFAYRGKVDSIQTAISRVLGYEMVMNLALGLAMAEPFKTPRHGPLGLDANWRHAIFSATLMQAMCKALPSEQRPAPGLSYLAGLLHNFGYLILGYLFRKEFLELNEQVRENPTMPVQKIEREMLGIDHGQLGAWLLQEWRLPEEIIIATREHHNAFYNGPHAIYAQMALVADRMLKRHNIGDATTPELPPAVLKSMGIDELQLMLETDKVFEGATELEAMARQLAV